MDAKTTAAEQKVAAARAALAHEVDELGVAVRSAVDLPAKVRKEPAKTAAIAGGALFLGLGGPRRVLRRARRVLRGGKDPAPRSVLPDEIDRLIADLGESGPAVRARLDREFADYLHEKRKGGRLPGGAAASIWHSIDTFGTTAATNAARKLVARLFDADPDRPPAAPPASPPKDRPS
jgi:hypothetical protein